MNIVFSKEAADRLRSTYTVLELETIVKDGVTIDAYCVVPAEGLNLVPLDELNASISLHEKFVAANKSLDYETCKQLAPMLTGKFNGELDTFYSEILNRIIK